MHSKFEYHPALPPSISHLCEKYTNHAGAGSVEAQCVSDMIWGFACRGDMAVPANSTLSPRQAGLLLAQSGLAEAFGLLYALKPQGRLVSLWVLLCPGWERGTAFSLPPAQSLQPSRDALDGVLFEVSADFKKLHRAEKGGDTYCRAPWTLDPRRILLEMPDFICARRIVGRVAAAGGPDDLAEEVRGYTGPMAVLRNPRTASQWRERFEADRWFESDLSPQDRLTDRFDLRAWMRFIGTAI